jgi:UDP-N-acetylglucosamine--N-acetylmuramyl-(pentapeptide) pyrophosphoryl-undecaprenol N-acetylglucosamine transferase
VTAPGAALVWSPAGVFAFIKATFAALFRARQLLQIMQPDVTVVFGGFLSPAFVIWSRFMRIPVALHEANRHAGKAVRLLSRVAQRIYAPPGVSVLGAENAKVVAAGYPLRLEIHPIERKLARSRLGLNNDQKTLVILGGSQGAMALNQWVETHYETLAHGGLNVVAVSGPGKGTQSSIELSSSDGQSVRALFLPFVDEMNALLSLADLVVSRAGAGAIAELTACHAPSILVPYPYAADQHQEANARFFEEQGGCVVMKQDKIEEELLSCVTSLLADDDRLAQYRAQLQKLSAEDAAESMATNLVQWVSGCSGSTHTVEERQVTA